VNRIKELALIIILVVIATLVAACGAASGELTGTVTLDSTSAIEPPADFQIPASASEVPRITAEELKKLLDAGEEIIVADTRAKTSFDYQHLAGAISVPENEVNSHLNELPKNKDIVFYCS